MKKAIWITLIVTLAYVVYLSLLTMRGLPLEEKVYITNWLILDSRWLTINLPFGVSPWWNVLLAPLTLIYLFYWLGQEYIIGKKPRRQKEENGLKYGARFNIHFVNVISLGMALALMVISAILFPLTKTDIEIAPLSVLCSGIFLWVVIYSFFGISLEFLSSLFFWKTINDPGDDFVTYEKSDYKDNKLSHLPLVLRYRATLCTYLKLGFIATLPFTIGITIGFIVRFIIDELYDWLNSLVYPKPNC